MGVELEDNDHKVLTYDANCPRHYLGELFIPLDQVDEFANKVIDIHDVSVKRHNAVRAVGFLEGFGALLWTQVGPNLADEEVVEFEKRVADIAAYIGLPSREGGC